MAIYQKNMDDCQSQWKNDNTFVQHLVILLWGQIIDKRIYRMP